MKDFTGLLCVLFIVIAPLNFIAFGFHDQMLGGDAMNGHQANGRFYVSDHGRETEVTKSRWYASLWHADSLFVTHLLGLGAILLAIFKDAFPESLIAGAHERAQIVRTIRHSGWPQADFRASGKIRSVSIRWLKVAVYPGGLIFQILSIAEFGILASEIDKIERSAAFLDNGATIIHCSPFLGNWISLHFADNKAAMQALLALSP